MTEKFTIVEMKLSGGNWTVRFTGPQSWNGYSPPTIKVWHEDENGRSLSQAEVAKQAHTDLVNSMFKVLRAAVISIPDANWDHISRTVLWPQLKTAFDDEHRPDGA